MIEKFEVKIVRMKSGEDIVCFCYEDFKNSKLYLKYPKTFYSTFDTETEDEELVLLDWLPQKAFGYQDVCISIDNILFTTLTTVDFGYEYLHSIVDLIDSESELSKTIKSAIEETSVPDKSTLH